MKVFYLHWNQDELESRIAALKEARHDVVAHWSTEEHARLGDFIPDAVVISLDRLPSHGRQVAEWFWEAKKRRGIPILFVGGAPDKVETARRQFPEAVYCASDDVPGALERLAKKRDEVAKPAVSKPLKRVGKP